MLSISLSSLFSRFIFNNSSALNQIELINFKSFSSLVSKTSQLFLLLSQISPNQALEKKSLSKSPFSVISDLNISSNLLIFSF